MGPNTHCFELESRPKKLFESSTDRHTITTELMFVASTVNLEQISWTIPKENRRQNSWIFQAPNSWIEQVLKIHSQKNPRNFPHTVGHADERTRWDCHCGPVLNNVWSIIFMDTSWTCGQGILLRHCQSGQSWANARWSLVDPEQGKMKSGRSWARQDECWSILSKARWSLVDPEQDKTKSEITNPIPPHNLVSVLSLVAGQSWENRESLPR